MNAGAHATPVTGEGSIEGTVMLTGVIPRNTEPALDPVTAERPGCRDAARIYSLPFGMSQPGPLESALVTAEAHVGATRPPPRRRLVEFRDCSISPRLMVMDLADTLVLHAISQAVHNYHFPKIDGMGASIAQMLQPGEDQEKTLEHPGRYIIHSVNYPTWLQTPLIVLRNPFYTQTDDHGHYRLEHVPAGRVTVHGWYPGAVPVDVILDVPSGGTLHQDFSLSPAPGATVPVVPPTDAGIGPT